jgi:hypothetical protein
MTGLIESTDLSSLSPLSSFTHQSTQQYTRAPNATHAGMHAIPKRSAQEGMQSPGLVGEAADASIAVLDRD